MTVSGGYRVLIVGCGELGSRHLQAVASLTMIKEIEIVDVRPEALKFGQDRLSQISDVNHSIDFRWLSSLEEAKKNGDLCIIATRAEGRYKILQRLVNELGYSSVLLEKIVAQSVDELEQIATFSTNLGLSLWVNCQSRAWPAYRQVKKQLEPGEPLIFNAAGGNLFLATNGIHAADLFAYYDGCTNINGDGSVFDQVLHPSKRGEGLYDLSGTLLGQTENGSSVTISYIASPTLWGHTSIASSRYRRIVDHLQGWAFEASSHAGWEWQQVPFVGDVYVSQSTKEHAKNILTTGKCELPTLDESLVSHRFILGELQPQFSKLLGLQLDRCPVT